MSPAPPHLNSIMGGAVDDRDAAALDASPSVLTSPAPELLVFPRSALD